MADNRLTMPRLLFLMPEDWYFWVHRRSLARAARAAGYRVALATRVGRHCAAIESEGIKLYPLKYFMRSGRNPLCEGAALAELVGIYRDFRPTVAHHETLKPAIYGPIAARFAGVPAVVNALVGLGYAFTSSSLKARLLRPAVSRVLGLTLNLGQGRVIVLNPADRQTLLQRRILAGGRMVLIRGTGVDTVQFAPTPEPVGTPVVVLAARMLWDKGVGEFVAAARALRADGQAGRFVLVGTPDAANPEAIARAQLEAWVAEGVVEWWGQRDDMPAVLAQANVVCLPSYHEGLPKVLLEAAASARAIVATDIPGCREIARAGQNAALVPVRDAVALTQALRALLNDASLRLAYGAEGRRIVERNFTQELVAEQTLALYAQLRGETEGAGRLVDNV